MSAHLISAINEIRNNLVNINIHNDEINKISSSLIKAEQADNVNDFWRIIQSMIRAGHITALMNINNGYCFELIISGINYYLVFSLDEANIVLYADHAGTMIRVSNEENLISLNVNFEDKLMEKMVIIAFMNNLPIKGINNYRSIEKFDVVRVIATMYEERRLERSIGVDFVTKKRSKPTLKEEFCQCLVLTILIFIACMITAIATLFIGLFILSN